MISPGIADFLLARIAEDEEAASAATPSAAVMHPGMGWNPAAPAEPHGFAAIYAGPLDEAGYRTDEVFRFGDEMDCEECVRPSGADMQHIARWDPARVSAECEAKRRVVERYVKIKGSQQDGDLVERQTLRWVMDHFALAYAAHPDYRQEWKP